MSNSKNLYGVMFGYFPNWNLPGLMCDSEVNLMQIMISDLPMNQARAEIQRTLNESNPCNAKADPKGNMYHIDTIQQYKIIQGYQISLVSTGEGSITKKFDYDDLFLQDKKAAIEQEYQGNEVIKLYIVNIGYYFMPSRLPQANVEPRKYLILPAKNPIECQASALEIAKKERSNTSTQKAENVGFHIDNMLELNRVDGHDIQLEYIGGEETSIETKQYFEE